uniref:Uncharacterized protein n=1 Tax=Pseudomonas phage HRDY3 TaxID=3236930 RepID=A0AB39CDC8_9VIRU
METLSTTELAAQMGVTHSAIQCRLIAANFRKRPKGITTPPDELDIITEENEGIGLFGQGNKRPWPKYYEKAALLKWYETENARVPFHRLKRRKT